MQRGFGGDGVSPENAAQVINYENTALIIANIRFFILFE